MRIRDPHLLRLLHFQLDECSLCGVTYPLHLHHVLLRSHGGDDVRANLLMLCQTDHEDYHQNRNNCRARLAAYVLTHRPDTVDYLVETLGVPGAELWFERHRKE